MSGESPGYLHNEIVPSYVTLYSPFQSHQKLPLPPPPPPPPLPPLLATQSQSPSRLIAPNSSNTDQDSQIPSELMQPLLCTVCEAHLNGPQQASCHYQGKNHQKKMRHYLEKIKKTAPDADTTLASSHGSAENISLKEKIEVVTKKAERPQKKFKPDLKLEDMYCKFCDVVFSSEVHAEEHYNGRNHLRRTGYYNPETKKWQKEPINGNANSSVLHVQHIRQPPGQQKSSIRTNVEDSILASVMATGATGRTPSKKTPSAPDFSMYRTPSGKYYCSNCNLTLNSEAQLAQHFDSKKHKSCQGDLNR